MNARLIHGLSEIADRYDHFILDIFGVIHDGIRPFPGTFDCLRTLKDAGKQVCCLSNSPRRASGALSQMISMGLERGFFDHVVTSGEATYEALRSRGNDMGDDCWFIGNALVSEILQGHGIRLVDGPEDASFILNSIPGTESSAVDLLKEQLRMAADKGLPMICANPDLVVNIGDTQYECAGTFALYYEELGGRVIYHGKPHAPVYERCYALLGRPDKSRICGVGDSFRTDIAGANGFGIDCVMNLVGIHWEEIRMDHAPDEADLAKLKDVIEAQESQPTYTMAGFAW